MGISSPYPKAAPVIVKDVASLDPEEGPWAGVQADDLPRGNAMVVASKHRSMHTGRMLLLPMEGSLRKWEAISSALRCPEKSTKKKKKQASGPAP